MGYGAKKKVKDIIKDLNVIDIKIVDFLDLKLENR